MTNPVDHSEWIDRYLRGELRGEELDVFERKLQQDPQFALEFSSHKLLADAIRAARKEELKRFIAERTRQRVITLPRNRSFLLGIAASIALFAAGWLGWKSVLPKMPSQEVAEHKNQNTGAVGNAAKSPKTSPQEKEQQDHTLAYQKQEMGTGMPEPMEETVISEDIPPMQQELSAVSVDVRDTRSNAPELVASVRVALAEWEPEMPEADVQINESVTVAKASVRKSASKTVENNDRAAANAPGIALSGNSSQAQFDLVFLNVPEPGTAYEMKGTQQIQLFNITYLNPLLIRYKGRHFLRSGGTWYELSIPSSGRLPLIPLKDKTLLNQFGGE